MGNGLSSDFFRLQINYSKCKFFQVPTRQLGKCGIHVCVPQKRTSFNWYGHFREKLLHRQICARADLEGNLLSTVNGVEMVIDIEVWKEVVDLDMGGVYNFKEIVDGTTRCRPIRECFLT